MHNRIYGCYNKSDDGSSCINTSKWILICVADQVNKLQSACNANCDVLIENNRVKHKVWPSKECNFQMSDKSVT